MMLIIFLSLILYQVVERLACNPKPKPTDEEAAQVWDYYMKEHHKGKLKYTTASEIQHIPLDKKAEFGKWLLDFVLQKREEKKHPPFDFPDSLDSPRHWSVPGGESGQLPPPWAYVPGGYYKPLYCYEHFQKGKCGPKYVPVHLTRWGYNHWTDSCQPFHYTGCGGNTNRFIRKEECEAACKSPVTCCDNPPSDYPSEYLNWAEKTTTRHI